MRTLWRFIAGFFKWTWRLLNFVREFVLNLFFIFLVLVGVGIATSVETAAVLSRKAVLRPIGSRHPNPKAAELELRLEEGLNHLGIGPQGLTGNSSVMGVHIESAARHPSTIGVAVSTGCWAHRRGTLLVHADLSFENLSHTRSAL